MEHENVLGVLYIIDRIKSHCAYMDIRRSVWVYTGFKFEELLHDRDTLNILMHTDVLVDGQYDETLRDVTLPFRGSSNQRIIDVKKSIAQDKVVLWTPQGEKA